MALSDPFSTTYEGSRQSGMALGQGIESAAGSVADVIKQQKLLQEKQKMDAQQRKQGLDMLQQFGLVKMEKTQPTVDDLSSGLKEAGKKLGAEVIVNQGDNEEQTKNNLLGIYKALKIPIPQGQTKVTVQPGTTMDMGGGMSYTAPKQEKSVAQQVAEYQDAQKQLEASGSSGVPTVNASGQLSIKSPAGSVKDIKGTAKDIVDGIEQGNLPPTLTGMSRTAGLSAAIEVEAQKRGFNLKQAQVDFTALNQLTKTMNQNQMVQLNTAFNSVENDIPAMKEVSNKLERTGFKPANSLIIKGDLNGVSLSPDVPEDQVKDAVKYVTQINLMRDNMAVAFMRGGVPTDQAFKLTDNIMNPAYSNDQIGAALEQIQINLNLRKSAVSNNPPYVPGQKQNPSQQMINATPGMGKQQGNSLSQDQYQQMLKDAQGG